MPLEKRKQLIKATNKLSISRQLYLLDVPKSSYYYKPKVNFSRAFQDSDLKDLLLDMYLRTPFYGNPRMTEELKQMGYNVNHKRVHRLRKELGLKTIYPRPRPKFNTSESCEEHKKYPYLLKNLKIEYPNQVWATDITYTAVHGQRVFVIAILELYSRKVLSYNVVNTMDVEHCIETLDIAIQKYGTPEIFNSDQGSQFTSKVFTEVLKKYNIRISMDGKGRCLDNAKMERFWWSLKYEDIKIKEYVSLPQLRYGVQQYVNFYNHKRLHSALDYKTPEEVFAKACND